MQCCQRFTLLLLLLVWWLVGCGAATARNAALPLAPTAPATPLPTPTLEPLTSVQLVPVVDGLDHPVSVTNAGDKRLFVIEQAGLVRVVVDGQLQAEPYLDIRDKVGYEGRTWDEQGLLGLAFHPQFRNTQHVGYGRFFLYYTRRNNRAVLARYQVEDPAANQAQDAKAVTLLVVPQPYSGHNAGQLRFGPKGFLYVGVGDGGSGGDPQNHAQDPGDLLGTILRLDVDQEAAERPYAIPLDNPFIQQPDYRDEIWAFGLRNPWRFSFDAANGDLYVADVGQDSWEELNWQPADSPGGENYGWNTMEGPVCYGSDTCDRSDLVPPRYSYSHSQGCAIVGGMVYRGKAYPRLQGTYLFSDFCRGTVWALHKDALGRWETQTLYEGDVWISSFGADADGEIYVVDNIFGSVSRIQP